MPFCPECRYEYNTDVSRCPDCDEWLVGSLEEAENRPKKSSRLGSINSRPISKAEYSDEIKKIMKSLPASPNIPTGPLAPGSGKVNEDFRPEPDSEIAQRLEEHDTWIAIARFPSRQLSSMISDALQSVDIPCLVMPGYSSSMNDRTMRAFGADTRHTFQSMEDDTLLVPEEFVQKADAQALEIMGEDYEQFKTPNG